MRIRIGNRREHGGGWLFLLVVIAVVGLGGCAIYKANKKAKQLEEARRQRELQQDEAAEAKLQLAEDKATPYTTSEIEPWITTPAAGASAHFHVNTNYYNAALEDESGF